MNVKATKTALISRMLLLSAVNAFGWLYSMCIYQYTFFKGGGGGTHDFGLASLVPAWILATAWSAFFCFKISKKVLGRESMAGFLWGGPLSILVAWIAGTALSMIMGEADAGKMFESLFKVLTIGGLLSEGRDGTGSGLAFFWLCIVVGTFIGFHVTFTRRDRFPLSILLVAGFLIVPKSAYPYGETIHSEIMTGQAILLLHTTTTTGGYGELMRQGANIQFGTLDEDKFDFPLRPRVRNHFYRPSDGSGMLVFDSARKKLDDALFFNNAITQYQSGTASAKNEAFKTLGHVLHLATQDMFSAPHVHNDIHFTLEDVFPGATFAPNSYETWTTAHVGEILTSRLHSATSVPEISGSASSILDQNARETYRAVMISGEVIRNMASPASGDLSTMFPPGHVQTIVFVPEARCAVQDAPGHCLLWEGKWELTGVGDCFEFAGCAGSATSDDEWWKAQRLDAPPGAYSFYIEDSAVARPANYRGRPSGNLVLAQLWALGNELPDGTVVGEQLVSKGQAASAAMMRHFARQVDRLSPKIEMHKDDLSGALLEVNAPSGGINTNATNVFVHIVDPKSVAYPTPSGPYRAVLSRLDAPVSESSVEFLPVDNTANHLFTDLVAGRYQIKALDGLGNESIVGFQIVTTPPLLTLTNADGETLEHGSISENAIVTSFAVHRPAPVRSLEFFDGNVLKETVLAPADTLDMSASREFLANSWHYTRACDVALNCIYSLFGVFAAGTTPPNPPGPPPPCPGCTQRPNLDPLPPPDPPNNPPPPPWPPLPPGPPTPPPCRGEECLNEPPAPEPSWVLKPKRPKYCDSPKNCLIPVAFPHDPNAKYGPAGPVSPGQMMTYTIEFENEGAGLALETFVRDTLDTALDDTTLVLRDMNRVNFLTGTLTPANFPWSYDARTRTITVMTGDADSRQGGRFILETRLKTDTAPGTKITNQAVVHFPNSLEVTPTNVIVSAVPLPTSLAYEGASSTTFLAPTRFAARLTAAGRPLAQQPVQFLLAGSSWTVTTDGAGLASISTAIAILPGAHSLQTRYAGDGLLYSAREMPIDFVIAKKPASLDAPFATARSTETARIVVSLIDDEGRPLSAQAEDPKTIHLELLQSGGVVSPLGSILLSGASVTFDIQLPRPLQISWSVRARFDGDLRYASAISSGVLRLIDQTPPTISILSPGSGRTYSSSQLIPIDFLAQDSEDPAPLAVAVLVSSGGRSVPVSNGNSITASSLSPGQWSLEVQATDWAGNQTSAQGAVFQVLAVPDVLAPRTSLSVGLPQSGTDPVFVTSATVIGFTAIDDLTTVGDGIGTGVERTEYALNGGSSTIFAGNFGVSTEGPHSVVFFSADFAGNVEMARTRSLFVDNAPPLTRLLIGGLPASTTNASLAPTEFLSFSIEESGSGVAATYFAVDGATSPSVFTSSFTLSVGTHSLTYHSVDNLGNTEAVQNTLLTVRPSDSVAPLLTLDYPSSTASGVEQAVGAVVQVRGRVSDEHDLSWTLEVAPGVATSSGFVQIAAGAGNASGILASWNTASLSGYQTLRLSATDAFGNASSTSAVVFVGSPAFSFAIGRKDSNVIVSTIKGPTGIAVRSDGAIWVANTENDTILLLSPAGVVLGKAGHAPGHSGEDKEHGKKDKDDDEEDASGLSFKTPQGLALDVADNLYVADRDLNRVVKLSPDGQVLLLQLGKRDGQGRPKPGSGPGELRQPFDAAVDANGDIYVADSGNRRIQVFNASGGFLREFGPGVLLSTSEIRGIALTAEGLWVSDKEQERIFLFSRAGTLIKSIGASDSAVGEISRMRGLASDRLGALYVVEPNRDRTQKFDPQGNGMLAFGSKAGLSQADKSAKRYLTQPIDAALAPDGSIWITDTGRDRIVRYALPTSGGYGVAAYSAGAGAGSSVEPARRVVDHRDGAKVERDDGAGVHVPKGALAADLEITVEKGDENQDKEQKTAKRRVLKITAVSEEVQYGPEGTTFSTPVTLTLPYDAAAIAAQGLKEDDLKVYYWNATLQDWEAMPSVVDKQSKTVNAQTSHFSAYQVGALGGIGVAAIDDFGLRDGYVFPNPSRNGSAVTFRMQPGSADSIEVRVYDLAGRKIHSSSDFRFRGALDDGNGKGAQNTYDHVWDVSGIGSGVYTYVMTAKKAGQPDIRKTGKIGIVK